MGKILSIDDSKIIRKMIKGSAEALGYTFIEAGDGKQGLEVLTQNHQDVSLVCLDIHMPEMNGIEALKRMKSNEQLRNIPVMMVTSDSSRNMIIDAIKIGAVNYVNKPFTQEELMTKMVESMGLAF